MIAPPRIASAGVEPVGKLADPADVAATAADHDRHGDDDDEQPAQLDDRHHDVALDRLADPAGIEGRDQRRKTMAAGTAGTSMKVPR